MKLERYHDAMGGVPFDPNLETRVLARLETARGEARPRRAAAMPRRRVLAAALAAALCLAVTAGAAVQLSGLFAPLFSAHPEIVDQSGSPLSARAVSAGYVLTANALFGDRNCLYVAMTLTREDGQAIDADDLFLHLDDIDLPGFQGGGYGAQVSPGQGKTDCVTLAASLFSNDPIPQGGTLTLTFDRLTRVGEDTDAPALAEGDWVLSFPIQYGDLSQTVALDAPIPLGDTGLVLDHVEISPLSVWVTGGGVPKNLDDFMEDAREAQLAGGFTLTLKDGTVLDLFKDTGNFSSSAIAHTDRIPLGYTYLRTGNTGDFTSSDIAHKGDGYYSAHMAAGFADLIPLDEMASLSFCGVTLPLNFPAE